MDFRCKHAIKEAGCSNCTGYDSTVRADLTGPCRHALREIGCVNCKGYDSTQPPVRRLCGNDFRHALKETWCPECQGLEPSPRRVETHTSARDQAIRAASEEERAEIKAWREHWRAMREVLCHWCNEVFAPAGCHADHVIPLSRGGKHSLSNLVISCATCNLRKNARMPEVWSVIASAYV